MQGLDFFALNERAEAEASKPRSTAEIVELLRAEGEEFAAWLERLTPEFLAGMVTDGDGKFANRACSRCLARRSMRCTTARGLC
jgi:hypothetical protein